jgi:hypothetical protein
MTTGAEKMVMPYTPEQRDRAIKKAASLVARELKLSDALRESVEYGISRAVMTEHERYLRDMYASAAGPNAEDQDLQIDEDAGISFSDGDGAYISAWIFVKNEDLLDVHHGGTLYLETSDGRTGTEVYVVYGGKVSGTLIDWDSHGEGETVRAFFTVHGQVVFDVGGDEWRRMESSGMVAMAIERALMFSSTGKPGH